MVESRRPSESGCNEPDSLLTFRSANGRGSPRLGHFQPFPWPNRAQEGMRKRDGFRVPDEICKKKLSPCELALLILYCRRADIYGRSFCGKKDFDKHIPFKKEAIQIANNSLEARQWFAYRIRRFHDSTIIVLQVPHYFERESLFWRPLYVGEDGSLTPRNESLIKPPRKSLPDRPLRVPDDIGHSNGSHPADYEPSPFPPS